MAQQIKGTFYQKRGDISRIDFLLADDNFKVLINALEYYRAALVDDVLIEVNAKGRV